MSHRHGSAPKSDRRDLFLCDSVIFVARGRPSRQVTCATAPSCAIARVDNVQSAAIAAEATRIRTRMIVAPRNEMTDEGRSAIERQPQMRIRVDELGPWPQGTPLYVRRDRACTGDPNG